MKVKELTVALKATRDMLSKWHNSAQAGKDLDRLIELMNGQEELSVAQFCAKVEKALKAESQGIRPKTKQKGADQNLVTYYTERLVAPNLKRTELEDITQELKENKNCRLIELAEIANALTNSGKSYRSKKDAIQDIEHHAHRRLDVNRRMEDTSKVF